MCRVAIIFTSLLTALLVFLPALGSQAAKNAAPALSISGKYPHYFEDAKGKPVLLLGDYTWGTFSDVDSDYTRMFESLKKRGLNQARVWLWWGCEQFPPDPPGERPHVEPYLREGSELANDGKPKYNLDKFNPAFFTRLKDMCQAARSRGIYLQLIMMDAWMIKHDYLWKLHAFNRGNNLNGVDGDPRNTGTGTDGEKGFCSLGNPKALKYQEAYIHKVVDTVNGFDNVYFEIANENYYSEAWELALCDDIKLHERTLPRQHMTIRRDYPSHSYVMQQWDPATIHNKLMAMRPLNKPLHFDTDWEINANDDEVRKAAWSALASGGHFSYMDDSMEFRAEQTPDKRATLHKQFDYIARFMKQIKPWEMPPDDALVKSGLAFAMANTKVLFAYLPKGGEATLNLTAMKGSLTARWYSPLTGQFGRPFKVAAAQDARFTAPDSSDWALLVRGR